MGWFDWLPWSHGTVEIDDDFDVDHVLANGLRDPQSAQQAISTLKRERKALVNRKKAVNKSLTRVSKWDTYRISRSSQGSPDLGAYQLSQAIRDANVLDQTSTLRKEQLAEIDDKIQAIDRAVTSLNDYVRTSP